MNLPKVTILNELYQEIDSIDIYKKLINQLNKDLSITGVDTIIYVSNPAELFNQFNIIIEDLIENNFQTFLNLLYRVDYDENKIRQIIKMNSDNFYQKITFELLKREWQKVWYRSNY